jgi:hypothetical protein
VAGRGDGRQHEVAEAHRRAAADDTVDLGHREGLVHARLRILGRGGAVTLQQFENNLLTAAGSEID